MDTDHGVACRTEQYRPGRAMDVYGVPDRGAVLLWHGSGPDERHLMAPLARHAAAAGVLVMAPDWSSEQPDGGRTALAASLDHARGVVRAHGVDPSRLVVAGWSLGGTAAVSLLLADPGAASAAVGVAGAFLTRDDPLTGAPPADLLDGSPAPAHFHLLHGTDDEAVDVRDGRRFAARLSDAGHAVRWWELPTDHTGIVTAEHDATLGAVRTSAAPHAVEAGSAVARVLVEAASAA